MNHIADSAHLRTKSSSARLGWALLFGTLVLAALAFAPAFAGPFLFDDAGSIPGNPAVEAPASLVEMVTPPRATALSGRPVSNLSLAANAAINRLVGIDRDDRGRLLAGGFRAGNLILHIITALLLFGFLRRTLSVQSYSAYWREHANDLSVAVVSIWLLHPLQTEPVNYVVQRTEVLVGCFYAATMYAWVCGWQAASARSRRAWRVTAVLLCLIGMGAKEVMVTAPLMIVLFDRAFMVGAWRSLFRDRERLTAYLALAATTIVILLGIVFNQRESTVGFGVGMPASAYLRSQGWAIPHYLLLAIWPSGLSLDYGHRPIGPGLPGLIALAVGLLLTVVAWVRAERWGWLAFLASWFYVILAPSSSFVPIVTEIAAERRMYLPLLSVILGLAMACTWAIRRWTVKPGIVLGPLAAAACLAAAASTFVRSTDYRSTERIWRDAVEKRPMNARAKLNLGTELLVSNPPRVAEAESLFLQAVRLDSTESSAWYNLGEVAMAMNDESRALAMYGTALHFSPGHVKARARYEALASSQADASASRAMDLARKSAALAAAGRRDSAVVLGRLALDQPDVTVATYTLVASVFLRTGYAAAAELVLRQASVTDSSNADIWVGLGSAQANQAKWDDAQQSFRRALAIDPNNVSAERGLRVLLRARGP